MSSMKERANVPKKFIFRCAYCQQDTSSSMNMPKPLAAQSKKVTVVRYCEQCNRPNKLELPDNWDVHVFILGKDEGLLGYRDETPILQGKKDL